MPGPLRTGKLAAITLALLTVSACGAEEPSTTDEPSAPRSSATQPATDQPSATAAPTAGPTGKPKGAGTTIDITFKGDEVDPSGVERRVQAGKAFTLHIVADQPGELHIHSSPEQELVYPAGTTDKTLTIDQPGIVEVESHDLDQLIVQLEVR